ncbi:MAG: GNAT family N-acetyltransferase [Chloroflexota bacterium]
MHLPTIRPMTPDDVEGAAAALLGANWGDRRLHLEFATRHPEIVPFVADADGTVVGTGMATINGAVGWVGTIWVHPDWRRRGLGMELTRTVTEVAEEAGCRTLLLVATEVGRPLYERIGFEVQTWYQMLEAPGLGEARVDLRIRPFRASDLGEMAPLALAATGEDRAHLHAALATPESTHCLVRDDGSLGGFVVRAPWGGGSTIAPRLEDAEAILQGRRAGRDPGEPIRAGVPIENAVGVERLLAGGWTALWQSPRLIRGDPLRWQPEAIWGQFNHAMG